VADGEPGNAYQEIRSLTGDMLDRARYGEWDELIRVETCRQELLDAVIGLRGDETGGKVNAAPTVELVDEILADHRVLEQLIAGRLSELAHAIGTAGVKDHARLAYGVNAEEEDRCGSW
jgi:hypothetical protein